MYLTYELKRQYVYILPYKLVTAQLTLLHHFVDFLLLEIYEELTRHHSLLFYNVPPNLINLHCKFFLSFLRIWK